MELKTKVGIGITFIILFALFVIAAESNVFVHTNFHLKNLYNISNITIAGIFSDGTLKITGGDISGAHDVNASNFYQEGNRTLDTGDTSSLNVNYSSLCNLSTYVNASGVLNEFWIEASKEGNLNVNYSASCNLSIFINASGVLNEPWIEASKEANLNVNYSSTSNLSNFINASGVLNEPWIEASKEGNLNVNSSIWSNLSTYVNASGVLNEFWIEASKEGNLNVNYSVYSNLSNFINASGVLNNPWVEDNSQDVNLTSNWTNLMNYPVACPGSGANQTFVTTIGDSNTCTAISDIYLLNTGDIGTGNYNFTNNISVDNLGLGGVSPQFPIHYQGAGPSGFNITEYLEGAPAFFYYDTNSTDIVEMVFAMPSDNRFYLEMCNSTEDCAYLEYSGANDEWDIRTRSGKNFYFYPDGSMSLTPSAAPAIPYEGTIYSNSSDHHLYFYNGTGWKQLD